MVIKKELHAEKGIEWEENGEHLFSSAEWFRFCLFIDMDSIVTFSRNSPHFLMDEKYSSFFFAMCAFSVGRNGSFVAIALMPIQYNKLTQTKTKRTETETHFSVSCWPYFRVHNTKCPLKWMAHFMETTSITHT